MREEHNKKIKTEKLNTKEKALTPVNETKKSFAVKRFFNKRHFTRKPGHRQEQKLAQDFTAMLAQSFKIMIPWLILPTTIFLIGAYYVFQAVAFSSYTPLWFKITFGIVNFGFFLIVGLLYGTFMGLVGSLKVFSQNFGLLLRQSMNSLKNSIESKINNISLNMFSKKELSNLINQTFADFSYNIKKYAQKTALGFAAIAIISSVLFFARHFIIRSIGVIKNKADAFALISARTSLFVALVLNLTLFTKIVLWLGIFLGIGILLLQALVVLYLR